MRDFDGRRNFSNKQQMSALLCNAKLNTRPLIPGSVLQHSASKISII